MGIQEHIRKILAGVHGDPFSFLGMHETGKGVEIRAFVPHASEARVIDLRTGAALTMTCLHFDGIFTASFPSSPRFPYRLSARFDSSGWQEFIDPYSIGTVLTDFDLHLISEGTHYHKYEKLGAHVREVEGVHGVHFAVWAPNAKSVCVTGDFNSWNRQQHPMRRMGSSGVWEIFIPGVEEGNVYKFYIRSRHRGYEAEKIDPYAFYFELRPKSGSVVHDITRYAWSDSDWMQNRPRTDWHRRPMSVYEVHLGSWMRVPEEGNRWLTYRELAETLVEYAAGMGYTHIELLPVAEHPLDASWGYQTIGYFAPTSRHGAPEDFMYFVDKCHQRGLGVILDWTPAHFPKDGHGLGYFDGTSLYEHADPRKGEHRDWGTLIFNYGRNEVRNFLISNALFWFDKYHIDGLRVDAVASMLYLDYSREPGDWIPNAFGGRENLEAIDFLKHFNSVVHHLFPGILTIAEESTAWPAVSRPVHLGGLGFDMKWNMGWMNDMLRYISKDSVYRRFHQESLTFSLLYAFNENFVLPLSHDEVVHGKRAMIAKMPGDMWQQAANLRLFYGYMFGHPGKKLLFMGGEFGQWDEWDFDRSIDWHLARRRPHGLIQKFVQDLNRLYAAERSLYEEDFDWQGFDWIDFRDADSSVISFVRYAAGRREHMVVVCNFTPVVREGYRVGVPEARYYREILNSDSRDYGGSNIGNLGGIQADPIAWHGKPCSVGITLPPLAVLYFRPV